MDDQGLKNTDNLSIWRVGHDVDGYSFILCIASSRDEAISEWREDYAETRKEEIADPSQGYTLSNGKEMSYADILNDDSVNLVVENMGARVGLGDGGNKLD